MRGVAEQRPAPRSTGSPPALNSVVCTTPRPSPPPRGARAAAVAAPRRGARARRARRTRGARESASCRTSTARRRRRLMMTTRSRPDRRRPPARCSLARRPERDARAVAERKRNSLRHPPSGVRGVAPGARRASSVDGPSSSAADSSSIIASARTRVRPSAPMTQCLTRHGAGASPPARGAAKRRRTAACRGGVGVVAVRRRRGGGRAAVPGSRPRRASVGRLPRDADRRVHARGPPARCGRTPPPGRPPLIALFVSVRISAPARFPRGRTSPRRSRAGGSARAAR